MTPSQTIVWEFDALTGELGERKYFENPGISGSIGFAWHPDARHLYVTNAALDAGVIEANTIALDVENTETVFTSDGNSRWSGSGAIDFSGRPVACWVWINERGDRVYSVGFRSNSISVYETSGLNLEHLQTTFRQNIDIFDSKDIFFYSRWQESLCSWCR